MGDISNKRLKNFELNNSEKLRNALLEDLRNSKRSNQVIQLNGKSSLVFANLAALTLASCGGGGGGGGSEPTPVASISNASFTFTEDQAGTFSITPNDSSVTISIGTIPEGITLTASDGTVLSNGLQLTSAQLSNISFSTVPNLNGSSSLTITASDGTTATLTFNISAVNDEPTLDVSSFSFDEDTAGSFNVSLTDVDGDSLSITVEALPNGGKISLADGTLLVVGDSLSTSDLDGLIFTPNENVNSAQDTIGSFILSVTDGGGTFSNSITLVVNAVNDAPTIGSLEAVTVFETVAADTTLLTLTGSDVDADVLTYSLSGDDADLFNIDSAGNVSFKVSPNYQNPSDADLNNTYSLNIVVTDAGGLSATSAILINILDVKPGGQAIDGYLVGATVWVDLDGDGIKDENEPETTTDKTGAFEFIDDIPAGTDIYVEGGYDLGTGKPNEQKFKLTTSITGDGSEALVISPVSTQISRAYAKTGVTLADAQEKVAKAYGLDSAFDNLTNFDPIQLAYSATTNEQAQAALTAQARNIMVSSLGELSKKVSEYFSTEIAPTTRTQISDIFKFGTQTLRYSSWDSGVDLTEQPRIVIELEGFEDLLASTSETFNDKIVEAILASEDLTKLFEMKTDGTGQFDVVITNATSAIILEIKNLILSEMGFDPATNFTTFKDLSGYTGETVTFLGATKTMGEWAVIMTDILDSQMPDPYTGRVNFGPDGGVTDMVGKYYAEKMVTMVRLMETMTGLTFENMTDSQIDQIVDMGFEYNRANTFNESYSRWVPFDEFGQELWSQSIDFTYNGERLRYDSNGNEIQGNTGQWQLTAEQVKAYLKDPTLQLKDGNWGNEFSSYNWTTKTGDLGVYLALAEGRTPDEVTTLMQSITATPESIKNFTDILTASFAQGTKVFSSLVTSALDFTLDKFEKFVEKTLDYQNDEVRLAQEAIGLPVSTIKTVTIPVADVTIKVSVVDGKFYFDGSLASNTILKSGSTVTFDTSDSSNAGNPLRFSETADGSNAGGTEYTTGITSSGTPGEEGASSVITVSDSTSSLYFYSESAVGMGNETLLTVTPAVTMDLQTTKGIGWQINPSYGDLNPVIEELGDFSYAITGGPDAALFRIDDLGTISFKDAAPNPNSPNDSDANGEYLITITVTDNSDGFTQDIEYVLAFPDYTENRSYASDTHPTLDPDQQVIVIPEGRFMGDFNYYDDNLGDSVSLYKGIKLNVTGLDDETAWLDLRNFDDQGNPIKDNNLFEIRKDQDDGSYYLTYRGDGGQPVFDFEAPKDANGDNVYELFLSLNDYGSGTDVTTNVEIIVVVTDSDVERPVDFSELDADGTRKMSVSEFSAPVANITTVEKNGKTLESYFVSGFAYETAIRGTSPTDDFFNTDLVTFTESTPFVVTVTGGPGSFKYLIDGVEGGAPSLKAGGTYTFDISDSSNATHPFKFSETQDGTWNGGSEYTTGVTVNGTPGEAGATVTIVTTDSTPDLFYYCAAHANQGNSAGQELLTFSGNTFVVTVTGGAGSFRYLIDGVEGDTPSLKAGGTYTFDISDSSNATHPFRFSETQDGTWGGGSTYTSGVTVNGTPGQAGATVTITVGENTPDLYYFCLAHANQGSGGAIQITSGDFIESGGSIEVQSGDYAITPITVDDLLDATFGGENSTTITGGADADLFYIYRPGGRDQTDLILFKARPEYANPADANGDNVYELQLTKTDSAGNSAVANVEITVREASENESAPVAAPETALILQIEEQATSLTDDNSNRNIVGSDDADVFSKQDLENGSKYVSGGLGDDVFSAGDDFLTGGEGSDTFLISLDRLVDLNKLGIVDDSVPYDQRGNKEGIYGYDQNRDGSLDLATELNHAWLNIIYDFTPGTDKLGLSTYGWSGTNVPSLRSEDVSYIQGTGDLSAHTLVVINNTLTAQQGYADGGVAAVLLNTEASSISKEVDEIVVGAQYENILGNIGAAIGATTTTITGPNGEDVDVLQLSTGEYVYIYANYESADNAILFQNLALSSSGELYVPRGEGPDFESPADGNKDNIYEFLFTGNTFSSLQLKQESWGGYNVDWENSVRTSDIAFTVFLEVTDNISDNVGKISIAEANFFTTTDANTGDAVLDTNLVDLVFSQISAVQGSLQDIDMKAIAEEINFDFSFFATADARTQAEDWFDDYQDRSFEDFGRELEETFERNLLSKYSSYTNADSLTNLTGTAENDTITGTDLKETIFGKKGDDVITGGAGDDVIFGDQGADTIDGGVGADSIDGGVGNDRIIIGEGLDVLDGGSGNDTFDFTNITDLPEFIKGGSGTDTLVLSGLSSSGLEYDDVDGDLAPDYTGIDLNKLVSIKETWTYTDDSGNEVSEEGWRNRVESIEKIDLRDSESQISGATFNDVLNITWDSLQRMSWDNRTWTIRGDNTDTVRLLGHEYSYNEGSTIKTQFEPFRFKGTKTEDGITYNVYELWDGRVQIEAGVTVIYGRRELGKAVAGENASPDFWYQYTTVYENAVAVFGKVKDSWDRDGDTITYSLDPSLPDSVLFNIDSATGEVTFKVAPNYEAPASISTGASSIGTTEADFASYDQNTMRMFNQYRINVIGDDGSGESSAQTVQQLYIDVRNLPDYDGYDSSNKVPFFKEMWGSDARFIDDASNQSIQIKGFDLDFDTLTWTLVGVRNTDGTWGTMSNGDTGSAIGDAPLTLSSTGLLTPKSTISYEDGKTWYNVFVQITDGKSTAVQKEFFFQVEDTLGDGSLTVSGTAMIGSYALGEAVIWQDLDNDGVKDAGEPNTTSNLEGRFSLSISKSDTDAPILATGGIDMGSGLANDGLFKINSNLKLTSGRDWGEYSLGPVSTISYSMQTIDRSLSDQKTVTDILKAFGMDPLWMDGDGNFYGERFYDVRERLDGSYSAGEWETFNLNLYTLNNLVSLIGSSASKSAIQIINDALADVNTKVAGTSNTSGVSSASLTTAQVTSIKQAAFNAAMESISELVTGKTAYDGFRLAEDKAVKITDHEGSDNVLHTPTYSVADGILTLDTNGIEINQAALQDALDLKAGSKGLKIEVEVGTLPTTAQTIEFIGKLIDGTNATIDSGERAIEVRFQVLVDPTQEVGSAQYVYVPGSSDITVIYTGEDGTSTSTTVEHSGNMVTVETSSSGVPNFVVDFTEVFARGIPQTNLSTYFTTSTASNGNYYTELTFTGAELKTSDGTSFTKVVAPFKVATTTTPVVYFDDTITVSEAEGWNQVELRLSKPATESFTLLYKFEGGNAVRDEDYWWWSNEDGYRSVTFVKGQSSAVVNVDIRNDSSTEGQETFNINFQIDSGSAGKVILPVSQAVVTIEDDESSSAFDYTSMIDKIMTKISSTLSAELKVLTDANSASLSGTSTSFTDILLSNSDINDISTYLSGEITEDVTVYDPITTNLVNLIDTYISNVRGPNGIRESLKIDGPEMAKDFAALSRAFEEINLSEFTSTSSDSLTAAFIADILSDSGFKYNASTSGSSGSALTYDRTISTDADAYSMGGFPAGVNRDLYLPSDGDAAIGTSGADSATVTNNNGTVYFGLEGNDTITKTAGGNVSFFGGPGNDKLIENTDSLAGRDYFDGGPGDDILHTDHGTQTFYKGGSGSDIFVLDADASHFDSGNSFNIMNTQIPGLKSTDIENGPYIIDDFQDGSDKIGLFGNWSGKTIVILQGSGDFSNHTFLLKGTAEKGGDSDSHYWAILWNTSASTISSDDFVLLDNSYGTSAVSGVTFSTSASDAGYNADDGHLDLSGSDNAFYQTSLIDSTPGFQFDNLNGPDPVLEVNDFEGIINTNYVSIEEDNLGLSLIDDIEEEEMLISLDIV